MAELVVGGKYKLLKKIGSGSFGEIYIGVNTTTGEEFGIKLEPLRTKCPQLFYEYKLYKILQGGVGIPQAYWFGVDGEFNVMVMDLLGPSLEDLFVTSKMRFSLKTVLMIGEQMIRRIEYIHSKNFIHRDIKPENFLIGRGEKANTIFCIDYGLSKKFKDSVVNIISFYYFMFLLYKLIIYVCSRIKNSCLLGDLSINILKDTLCTLFKCLHDLPYLF